MPPGMREMLLTGVWCSSVTLVQVTAALSKHQCGSMARPAVVNAVPAAACQSQLEGKLKCLAAGANLCACRYIKRATAIPGASELMRGRSIAWPAVVNSVPATV